MQVLPVHSCSTANVLERAEETANVLKPLFCDLTYQHTKFQKGVTKVHDSDIFHPPYNSILDNLQLQQKKQ